MRIFLIGYMYSGKTTIGRLLAQRLNVEFIDLDQYFENRYRCTIPRFFSLYGEQAFRTLESQLLRQIIAQQDNFLLSTGGGTPCFNNNIAAMNAAGISLYLSMGIEAICQRAVKSKKVRPLLQDMTSEERHAYITAQLADRRQYYQQAVITLDVQDLSTSDIATLATEQIALLQNNSRFF